MEKQPAEKPVEKAAEKAPEAPKEAPKAEKPKKKKTGLIIGIIIALLAIAGGVVAAILLLNKGDTTATDETVSNIIADLVEKKDLPNTEFKGKLTVNTEGVNVNADINGKYGDKKAQADLDAKINFGQEINIKASLVSDGSNLFVKLNGMPDLSAMGGDSAQMGAMLSMFLKEGTWYSMPAEMTAGMTNLKISGGANCGTIDLLELAKSDKSWVADALRDTKIISLEKADGDLYKVYANREETVKLIKTVNSKISSETKCSVSDQVKIEGMDEKQEIPGLLLGFKNGQISKVKYENAEAGMNLDLDLSYPGNVNIEIPTNAESLSDLFTGMFGGMFGGGNFGGGSNFSGYDFDDDDDDDNDIDWSKYFDDDDDDDDDSNIDWSKILDSDDFDADSYIESLLDGENLENLQNSLQEAEKALESLDNLDLDSLEGLLKSLQ